MSFDWWNSIADCNKKKKNQQTKKKKKISVLLPTTHSTIFCLKNLPTFDIVSAEPRKQPIFSLNEFNKPKSNVPLPEFHSNDPPLKWKRILQFVQFLENVPFNQLAETLCVHSIHVWKPNLKRGLFHNTVIFFFAIYFVQEFQMNMKVSHYRMQIVERKKKNCVINGQWHFALHCIVIICIKKCIGWFFFSNEFELFVMQMMNVRDNN